MGKSKSGLHSIPSVIQLPGGVRLQSLWFRVVEYNDDGSPKLFELMPEDAVVPPFKHHDGNWKLFASEEWIRKPGQNQTG